MDKNSIVYKELKKGWFQLISNNPAYDYIYREDLLSALQKIKEDAEKQRDEIFKASSYSKYNNKPYINLTNKIEAYQELIDALNMQE